MVFIILFWCSVFFILYSYIIYPVILLLLSIRKQDNKTLYNTDEVLPGISVILSVCNEEEIIEQRIQNIYKTNYPVSKIEVMVGSDGSNDNTNNKLELLKNEYPTLSVFKFSGREGKPNTINRIINFAKYEILVLTDAKVFFDPSTLYELVKHFKNQKIGCVGGRIISKQKNLKGISLQEKTFLNNEIKMKIREGKIWGTSMGVYGACYAMRKNLFTSIPDGFAVEDFFLSLITLKNNFNVIFEPNAISYQNVTDRIKDEFTRKVRISAGNYQNLKYFGKLLFKFDSIAYCFFSHKVIRWFVPILLITTLFSNLFIINFSPLYLYTFKIQVFLLCIPIIDFFLHNIRLDIIILRFVSHFYAMNLALFIGFIKYLKGEKTNVWEPTKR